MWDDDTEDAKKKCVVSVFSYCIWGYSLSLLGQIYHIQEVGLTYRECLDVIFISYQITCQIRVRWQQSKFETYLSCLMVMSLSVPIATHCMCCSDVIILKGGSLEHNNNSSHFCSVVSHWQGWAHGSLLRPLLLDFKFGLKLTEWFRCQLIEILFPTEFATTRREAQLHPRKVCKHQQICGGTADQHSKHHLCGSRPCCFL